MRPVNLLSDQEFEALLQAAAALPDAPPPLLRAAVNLWKAPKPSVLQATAEALVQRITAVLSFDSWAAAPMAAGVRALPSDSRHLLFSAKGRDIDLRIAPVKDEFALTGQILGPDESGEVKLVQHLPDASDLPPPMVASLDALGEFRLEGIARGTYLLSVHVGSDEISLPPIEVGDRQE